MGRLVEIEPDLRPYLAAIIVAALQKAGDKLVVPQDLQCSRVSQEDFETHLTRLATQQYPTYGILEQLGPSALTQEEEKVQQDKRRDMQLTTMLREIGGLGQSVRALEEVLLADL